MKTKIREYCEENPVTIEFLDGRYVVKSRNEAGCKTTEVDLQDIIEWVKENMPELLR